MSHTWWMASAGLVLPLVEPSVAEADVTAGLRAAEVGGCID